MHGLHPDQVPSAENPGGENFTAGCARTSASGSMPRNGSPDIEVRRENFCNVADAHPRGHRRASRSCSSARAASTPTGCTASRSAPGSAPPGTPRTGGWSSRSTGDSERWDEGGYRLGPTAVPLHPRHRRRSWALHPPPADRGDPAAALRQRGGLRSCCRPRRAGRPGAYMRRGNDQRRGPGGAGGEARAERPRSPSSTASGWAGSLQGDLGHGGHLQAPGRRWRSCDRLPNTLIPDGGRLGGDAADRHPGRHPLRDPAVLEVRPRRDRR